MASTVLVLGNRDVWELKNFAVILEVLVALDERAKNIPLLEV